MDRRTTEGPMDWEYQDQGPLDPSSPFTRISGSGRNVFAPPPKPSQPSSVFGSPSRFPKLSQQPNVFGTPTKSNVFGAPSKFAQDAPQMFQPTTPSRFGAPSVPGFSPQIPPKTTASPFRNPAFATPRRPFDDPGLSEASGQEDSPAPADTPDLNDTPDADHMSDVSMTGTVTPSRVDKARRYGRAGLVNRKHAPARGELRSTRDFATDEVLRKRKRHNHDRDVGSVARYADSDSDEGEHATHEAAPRKKKVRGNGWISSLFQFMEDHPDAPYHLWNWFRMALNCIFVLGTMWVAWMLYAAVTHEIQTTTNTANEALFAAREKCSYNYDINGCENGDRPALVDLCHEWNECRMQNVKSDLVIKNTIRHVGVIINEFVDTLNMKSLGFIVCFMAVFMLANSGRGGHAASKGAASAAMPSQSGHYEYPMAAPATPGSPWTFQTPRTQRHRIYAEDTDTDASPPKFKTLLPPHTPSAQRSPTRKGRSLSPLKRTGR